MAFLQLLQEFLITLVLVLYNTIKAIIFTFIPAPQKKIDNEIMLITGAGNGIGQLMAIKFAKRKATIVAWDINSQGLEETEAKVKAIGGKIYTYICDVSKRQEVNKVAEQVSRDVGEVSILINNAGVVSGTDFLDTPDEKLIRTFNVNVMAHFWTLKAFLPAMYAKNKGHIVTIASSAGLLGVNRMADYCASKFANVGFTESLSLEMAAAGKDGIHCTTVCPYQITTGMFKGCGSRFPLLMPEMTPEYAASRIVRAVLTEQKIVCMPRIMYQFSIIKSLLPVDASLPLMKFFGGLDFMNNFVGREKQK